MRSTFLPTRLTSRERELRERIERDMRERDLRAIGIYGRDRTRRNSPLVALIADAIRGVYPSAQQAFDVARRVADGTLAPDDLLVRLGWHAGDVTYFMRME